jgi:hypothetical protein
MSNSNLTAERLRELLHYDPETGIFMWREPGKKRVAGRPAGSVDTAGYRLIRLDGKLFRANRLAWLHTHGRWPDGHIDHISGDVSDDRIANLRDATRSVNAQNMRQASSKNATGFLGVSVVRGRYYAARIAVDGKPRHIGCFDTPEAAHAAYIEAKRRLHPGNTL